MLVLSFVECVFLKVVARGKSPRQQLREQIALCFTSPRCWRRRLVVIAAGMQYCG